MPESPLSIDAEIKGLKELQQKTDQIVSDLSGDPIRAGMAKATLLVTRSARKNAPVDTGRLRASITPEVVVRDKVVKGIVGSNVKYAPFQELGTSAHTPPWDPIYRWALRKTKGNVGKARALASTAIKAISIRGNIALRFLQRALEDNTDRIAKILGDVVGRIVNK